MLDEGSRKLVDSVVKEDEILEENITSMLDMLRRACTSVADLFA